MTLFIKPYLIWCKLSGVVLQTTQGLYFYCEGVSTTPSPSQKSNKRPLIGKLRFISVGGWGEVSLDTIFVYFKSEWEGINSLFFQWRTTFP